MHRPIVMGKGQGPATNVHSSSAQGHFPPAADCGKMFSSSIPLENTPRAFAYNRSWPAKLPRGRKWRTADGKFAGAQNQFGGRHSLRTVKTSCRDFCARRQPVERQASLIPL